MKYQKAYLIVVIVIMALGLVNIAITGNWLLTYVIVQTIYAVFHLCEKEIFGFAEREGYWNILGLRISRRAQIKRVVLVYFGGALALHYLGRLLGDGNYIYTQIKVFLITFTYGLVMLEIGYFWQVPRSSYQQQRQTS